MKSRGARVQARAHARRIARVRRELAEKARRDALHQAKIKNDEEKK
jgi:hypothetical protein